MDSVADIFLENENLIALGAILTFTYVYAMALRVFSHFGYPQVVVLLHSENNTVIVNNNG